LVGVHKQSIGVDLLLGRSHLLLSGLAGLSRPREAGLLVNLLSEAGGREAGGPVCVCCALHNDRTPRLGEHVTYPHDGVVEKAPPNARVSAPEVVQRWCA